MNLQYFSTLNLLSKVCTPSTHAELAILLEMKFWGGGDEGKCILFLQFLVVLLVAKDIAIN